MPAGVVLWQRYTMQSGVAMWSHASQTRALLGPLAPQVVQAGLAQLATDLRSGRWDEQFGWLRRQESLDLGYQLVIAQK